MDNFIIDVFCQTAGIYPAQDNFLRTGVAKLTFAAEQQGLSYDHEMDRAQERFKTMLLERIAGLSSDVARFGAYVALCEEFKEI